MDEAPPKEKPGRKQGLSSHPDTHLEARQDRARGATGPCSRPDHVVLADGSRDFARRFRRALVLSFPVRWLSRIMPRWLAMVVTFLVLVGLSLLAFLILVPILVVQLVSFVKAAPEIATGARDTLRNLLQPLTDYGLLKGTPDEFMADLGRDLLDLARSVGKQILGGLIGFVSGTISL